MSVVLKCQGKYKKEQYEGINGQVIYKTYKNGTGIAYKKVSEIIILYSRCLRHL